jgi:hypothetical protein
VLALEVLVLVDASEVGVLASPPRAHLDHHAGAKRGGLALEDHAGAERGALEHAGAERGEDSRSIITQAPSAERSRSVITLTPAVASSRSIRCDAGGESDPWCRRWRGAVPIVCHPTTRSVAVGRDALGNVLVTGDRNNVDVKLTVVADSRRRARRVQAATSPASRVDTPCPYPGMRPFTAHDAAHFHGRDHDVNELIGRLRAGEREIFVIGPSGSGKLSLVMAAFCRSWRAACRGSGRAWCASCVPASSPRAVSRRRSRYPEAQRWSWPTASRRCSPTARRTRACSS